MKKKRRNGFQKASLVLVVLLGILILLSVLPRGKLNGPILDYFDHFVKVTNARLDPQKTLPITIQLGRELAFPVSLHIRFAEWLYDLRLGSTGGTRLMALLIFLIILLMIVGAVVRLIQNLVEKSVSKVWLNESRHPGVV